MRTISLSGASAHLRGALMGWVMVVGGLAECGAATVAHTGFEEPGSLGDIAGTVQRILISGAISNEAGLANARYVAGDLAPGTELGFTTAWLTNANSLADGVGPVTSSGDTLDLIGVTDLVPPGTNFASGSFGFIMEDVDGEILLRLDAVDLSGYADVTVGLSFFLNQTTWEADDYVRFSVTGPGTNLVLLDTTLVDIDDLGIEGAWNRLEMPLEGFDEAVLQIAFSSNAGDERLWIDDIVFSGVPIPEPSVACLFCMGAGALALAIRRRRGKPRP